MIKINNIFLCGFMGCGKTHVGRELAISLGRSFFDLDEEIVIEAKCSIPEIFEKFSEEIFRDIESRVLMNICKTNPGAIISTGGGIFKRSENAVCMKKNGTVFYLVCQLHTCYDRIKNDTNRPLARAKSFADLSDLYDERKDDYLVNSDWAINANNGVEDIINQIDVHLRVGKSK